MKKILIFLAFALASCSSPTALHTEIYRGKEILVGKTTRQSLRQNPYAEWFEKNYEAYHPGKQITARLKPLINQYDFEIYMGTWCGDSRRHVPVFFKVIDQSGYHKKPVIYTVPRKYKSYKPAQKKNIIRVPTFIVLKNGREIGRIIEYPMESIEKDLLKIIHGNYHHELQNAR